MVRNRTQQLLLTFIGLSIAGAIFNNVVKSRISTDPGFSPQLQETVLSSLLTASHLLNPDQLATFEEASQHGMNEVFFMYLGLMCACFVFSLPVSEKGLPSDPKPTPPSANQVCKEGERQDALADDEDDDIMTHVHSTHAT